MYLRVTNGRFEPAKYDEMVRIAAEVKTAVSRLPGFQNIYQGFDRNTGTVAAISLWDTEEHAHFSRDGLGEFMQRIYAAGAQLDPPMIYEIAE